MSPPRTTFDRRHIGHAFPAFSVVVEASRIRFFAQVTRQADPIYHDEDAAKAAGFASLPVPPTFVYCLETERSGFDELFRLLGADSSRMLHAEQDFAYFATPCAGDTLTFEQRIDDIYEKKGGLLQFVVRKTKVTNARGDPIAELRNVIVLADS